MLDEFWIEYQSSSIKRYEKEFPSSAQALDRLISKDQIAVAAVFRCKNAGKGKSSNNQDNNNNNSNNKTSESDGQSSKVVGNHLDGSKNALRDEDKDEDPLLMIVNTHIHWDPAFPDVKLMQVCMLLEELETITTPLTPPEAAVVAKYGIGDQPVYVDTFASGLSNETAKKIMTKRYPGVPMLICGDFNSMPDSGVYEYVRVCHTTLFFSFFLFFFFFLPLLCFFFRKDKSLRVIRTLAGMTMVATPALGYNTRSTWPARTRR